MKHQATDKPEPLRELSHLREQVARLKKAESRRQHAEEKLTKALEWQEAIIEGSRDAIFISDAQSKFIMVNEAACNLTGYSREELLNMKIPDLHEEMDLDAYKTYHRRILNGEELVSEAKVLRKDGRKVDVEFNNRRIIISETIYMHTVARDISQRKQAEEALRASEARYRSLVQTAGTVILQLSADGCILEWNREAERVYGYQREEVLGKDYLELFLPEEIREEVAKELKKIIAGEETRGFENPVLTREGEQRVLLWNATRQLDSDGAPVSIIACGQDITERKQAEKALLESQVRLELLNSISTSITAGMSVQQVIESTVERISAYFKEYRVAYSTIDSNGQIRVIISSEVEGLPNLTGKIADLKCAPEYLKALRKGKSMVVENTAKDKRCKPLAQELLSSGARAVLDVPLRHSESLVGLLCFDSKVPRNWSDNEIATLQDIGDYLSIALKEAKAQQDRKLAEKALSESEKRYRELMERVPDGIYRSTPEGKFLMVNSGLVSMLGYESHEDLLQADIPRHIYFSPDERIEAQAKLREQNQTVNVFRAKKKDGSEIWVEDHGHLEYDKNGEPLYYEGVLRDITARKRTEESLKKSEEKYRTLVERMNEGLLQTDENEVIQFANRRFCEMVGFSREELIGKDATDLFLDENNRKVMKEKLRLRRKNVSDQYEICMKTKSGESIWVQISGNPIIDEHSNMIGSIGIHTDITERKRLEEELARSQRLETAGRVAGQIAHDFNNLLTPLTAYPTLVRQDLPADHSVLDLIDEMETSATKIAEINQQLLALGRRGHYRLEPVDLNELLEKTLMSLNLPKEIVVKKDLAQDLMMIKGGSAQLTRALTNLFLNAKEAMQDIGVLSLKTENVYLDKPVHGYQTVAIGEYVKLEIADTGTGIQQEILDKIFEPFFSTKQMDRMRGSGLGLSVVHGIVEDHQGYITIDTEIGQGTRFSVYFPIAREATVKKQQWLSVPEGRHEKILFVDDDPVQRRVVKQLLQRLGYKVHTLSSGEEAVTHLTKKPYDLLILDMAMNGIDGAETYQRILEFQPHQKAIILSGYAMSDKVEQAVRLGAGSFVSKPVNFDELAMAVRKELDKPA